MVVDFYKMDEEFWDFQKEKKLSYSRINMTAFFFWGGGGGHFERPNTPSYSHF